MSATATLKTPTVTPAGLVIADYIGDHIDGLNTALADTLRAQPHSAADTRANIYRVRTAIRGYRHLFVTVPLAGPQLEQLLNTMKRTQELETLAEHFAHRFEQLSVDSDHYPSWYSTLLEERRDSYHDIERICEQTWVAALLARVRMFSDHPELTPDGERPASSLMDIISRSRTHLLDTYAKMSHAADINAARELTRQSARETRFLAEAAQDVLGTAVADIAHSAGRLHDDLNDYRQINVARTWLLRLPGKARADELTASLAELEKQDLHRVGDDIQITVNELISSWS
ncbi:CHAD domain-containing protein [Haloglycomyces albus]|uniref:CHAD domain-containing protein n=1 Tax=Haloglycomyces albus TaxID=526067 RepID=UPI00046D659D|nr:CHAD domain-containing protein [Haloglycomyces albus]